MVNRRNISRGVEHGIKRKETSESLAAIVFLLVAGLAWFVGSRFGFWAGTILLLIGAVVIWRWYYRE